MPSFAIIVPCYNEETRLQTAEFISFANHHTELHFYFVNDGSTDNTKDVLEQIRRAAPSVRILTMGRNSGKGEAIRAGLAAAIKDEHTVVGYLDADLSTDLDVFLDLLNILAEKELDLVLGSRIKKIDTLIKRSFFRHIVGRILATAIDQKFRLGVYDTQCGAKVFQSIVIGPVIRNPFHTRWFFDVEILLRLRPGLKNLKVAEIPLLRWQNRLDSKLSVLSFPSVIKDLMTLLTKYSGEDNIYR